MDKDTRIAQDEAHFNIKKYSWTPTDPVLFYKPENSWGGFSNFSPHPVGLPHPFTHKRVIYYRAEHRFQAMKAMTAEDHDWVAGLKESKPIPPFEAKKRGRAVQMRPDWGDSEWDLCYYVMVEVVLAKVLQNSGVRASLSRSSGRLIYEDSPTDDIWGWRYGHSYTGKNLLGLALMHVRNNLR